MKQLPAMGRLALLIGPTVAPIAVHGQQPFARSELNAGSTVTVGQPVTITVSVFVPSFFQGAPAYAELDVDDAITIFNDRGSNLSERIGGQTWAGQSRSYTIYPQRSGAFEITDLSVEVRYRSDSGTVAATATAPPVRFEAYIPPEAAGLDYFVAASDVTLEESFDVRPDSVRVGDAFERTLTTTVSGALSIVIPPLDIDSIPGLAIYPDPPRVDDTSGERGAQIIGTRVESLTYVAQEAGEYRLPAIALSWWDVDAETLKQESIPEVTFVVLPNPDVVNEFGVPSDSLDAVAGEDTGFTRFSLADFIRRWGPVAIGLALLLVVAQRLTGRYGPRLKAGLEEQRRAHAESEGTYFRAFRAASRTGDPRATANALAAWLDRWETGPLPATFERLARVAGDPELERQAESLGTALYGRVAPDEASAWSPNALYQAVARARRKGRARRAPGRVTGRLGSLNPQG